MFYIYSNLGNETSSFGVVLNIEKRGGVGAYISSNIGIGTKTQITPYFTIGSEISLLKGISISIEKITIKTIFKTIDINILNIKN
ncbi:hypothetical protein J6Y73_00580 [bacterium]|nr:hypothetical protein [bacterium]